MKKFSINPKINLKEFSDFIQTKNEIEIERILNLIKEELDYTGVVINDLSVNDDSTPTKIILNFDSFNLWTGDESTMDDLGIEYTDDELDEFNEEFYPDDYGTIQTDICVDVIINLVKGGYNVEVKFDYQINEYSETKVSKMCECVKWGYEKEKEMYNNIEAEREETLKILISLFSWDIK
jgi:hypothetical protein